jgi:hypothetical protein
MKHNYQLHDVENEPLYDIGLNETMHKESERRITGFAVKDR